MIKYFNFLELGGGGGKGTWGKICEEYGDGDILDPNDPNYDSDNMVSVLICFCAYVNWN